MATPQQMQQEIQNELAISNQLLHLIHLELQKLKQFIRRGGEFEITINQNEELMKSIASMQQIDLANIPPVTRKPIKINDSTNQNLSYQEQESLQEDNSMDDSQ